MISEPQRRISSLSSPTALPSAAPRSEFEQTSSAELRAEVGGVRVSGFCSSSRTRTPALGELVRTLAAGQARTDHRDERRRRALLFAVHRDNPIARLALPTASASSERLVALRPSVGSSTCS